MQSDTDKAENRFELFDHTSREKDDVMDILERFARRYANDESNWGDALTPQEARHEIKALIESEKQKLLEHLRGQGERGGHDVYSRTIGEAVLAELSKRSKS